MGLRDFCDKYGFSSQDFEVAKLKCSTVQDEPEEVFAKMLNQTFGKKYSFNSPKQLNIFEQKDSQTQQTSSSKKKVEKK